ncbi:MAG: multiprotein bridging factor aMBF1 [Candidatus Nanohaloarchaea archaeon]
MSSCELCGRDVDSLKKVKIEGATLSVCDNCSDMGEQVSKTSRKRSQSTSRSKKRSSEEILINNYGEKLKKARESKQLSIKEVAEDLNEKESLISKIEKEQLKPDKPLARKLGKKFELTLYTNPEVNDYSSQSETSNRKATVGDVAEIND